MGFVKNLNKIAFLYLFVFPLMTILTIYFYIEFDNRLNEVSANILKNEIVKVSEFSKNISKNILKKTGKDIYTMLNANLVVRENLESEISSFISKQYAYVYLIYQDKDKKFRYLLDGSRSIEDKGEFNQKFDPQSDIWQKVFEEVKPQIATQDDIEELWVTYLFPLVVEEKTVAVLAFDFSIKDYYETINSIKPLKDFFFYLTMFMLSMLLISYVQVYLHYRSRKRSIIDPLTLTYNRLYMKEVMAEINLENYQICMMDIDYFKRVNDIYGHKIGDKVLENIAKLIKSQIRHEDILIRYGGEEFLLFIFKQDGVMKVDVPNRIRKTIKDEEMLIGEHKVSVSISCGVNIEPNYCKNIEEAIKIADEQLYKAKITGRNRVVSTKNRQLESESSKKILEVKEALDEDRIICFYQPIFDITNDRVIKYEALVRMIDKNGKIISPHAFLSSIKDTTTYVELTKRVLEFSIEAIEKFNISLSINLSVEDFFNADIVSIIKDILINKKEIAEKITLEILEQREITDINAMKNIISDLKKLGVKIALDDFGSGYANFSYLMHLQIDIIKIDGSLIRDIDKNQNALYITKAIVAFCEKMELEIIAEAVETKSVFDIVKSIGIKNVQGYYLAKPSCVFSPLK